jgi:hypothetical protein
MTRLCVGTLLLVLGPAVGDALGQGYRLVEFRPLPGRTTAAAHDLNNHLQIVGLSGDQVCVWDAAGDVRALGLSGIDNVVINNLGVIAGTRLVSGRREPFLWSSGIVTRPPIPPGDFIGVRRLTDNGILLMAASTGSWAAVGQTLYDLKTLTDARIDTVNELGTLGGVTGSSGTVGYLRYLNGVVLTMPDAAVQAIGSAGHFGGSLRFALGYGFFFGRPDGTVSVFDHLDCCRRFAGAIHDVNRHGAFVGHDTFISFGDGTAAILYRDGRLSYPGSGISDVDVQDAYEINDTGYILASARIASAPASTVLLVPLAPQPPSGLSFSVTGSIVTLTWASSADAVYYVVEAGSVPGAANLFNAPIGSEPRVTAPVPPGRYYVRVRAGNDLGLSGPCAEVVIDVP